MPVKVIDGVWMSCCSPNFATDDLVARGIGMRWIAAPRS
jgi:hypothetical protein